MLEFYTIESPLAQPRNAILGQLISAVTGISVAKLFLLSPKFDHVQWVAGALACACATALMALTKTVHPPAGATALLAVVDTELLEMGWYLLVVVLLSGVLMLAVALLLNNIERQFPVYWWTPEDKAHKDMVFMRRASTHTMEEGASRLKSKSNTASHLVNNDQSTPSSDAIANDTEATTVGTRTPDSRMLEYAQVDEVVIKRGQVIVPENMYITQEEELLLESMCYRL